MKITRNDFLRLTGLSLLAACGKLAVQTIAQKNPAGDEAAKTKPIRWGMVIDLQKCRKKDGCGACIKACETAHNVPRIAEPAHQVKWIWTEPFANVFPFAQTEYTQQSRDPGPAHVQSLRRSALHAGLPHAGDMETRRWHRDDGLSPLHRLPLLHGRLCLWFSQL